MPVASDSSSTAPSAHEDNNIRPPRNSFVARARKIYNPVGFKRGYNFLLWFVFGGALFGFSAARLEYLDFFGTLCNTDRSQRSASLPGECFYYLRPVQHAGIIIHLGCILPAAMLAVLQFVPAIRYKAIVFHRINGYLIMLLSLVGTIGAFLLIRHTAGGGIDVQTSAGLVGVAFLGALIMAYVSIKRMRIDLHRAWMLRAWVWAGSIITIRVLLIIIAVILPMTGEYYFSEPCDKVAWQMNNDTKTLATYPACAAYLNGSEPDPTSQWVSVRATMLGARNPAEPMAVLNMSFGTAMWFGIVLHAAAVEVYLALTQSEADRLRRVSEERRQKLREKEAAGPEV